MDIMAHDERYLHPISGNDSRERELVEQARSGDREAFGELVRRHRAAALGLAGSLTQDAYLAEDIVQEALIRAFLHVGSLMDTSRFMPWFHRIVRNQAYMKLRRGGPSGKEVSFTSLESRSGRAQVDPGKIDWSDIDHILFLLMDHAAEEARSRHNPEEYLVRKEMMQSVQLLLNCLNKRERSIFEARFFGELLLWRLRLCSTRLRPMSTTLCPVRGPSCKKKESESRYKAMYRRDWSLGCLEEISSHHLHNS